MYTSGSSPRLATAASLATISAPAPSQMPELRVHWNIMRVFSSPEGRAVVYQCVVYQCVCVYVG
jgi:hypothetical protein